MKKSLHRPFMCLTIALLAIAAYTRAGAQPSPDSLHAAKSMWGTIVGEKKAKSYTTKDGRLTFRIGDRISIGMASGNGETRQFQYIHDHISSNRFVKLLNTTPAQLDKRYETATGTITNIYEALLNPTDAARDAIYHDCLKKVVVEFTLMKDDKYDADIELALRSREIETN